MAPALEPGPNVLNMHVVGVGGRLRVTCLPSAGLPRPQVQWLTPQQPPPQQAGSLRVEGATLLLEDATYDHAGNYTCLVSNLAGNASVHLWLVVTREWCGGGGEEGVMRRW